MGIWRRIFGTGTTAAQHVVAGLDVHDMGRLFREEHPEGGCAALAIPISFCPSSAENARCFRTT